MAPMQDLVGEAVVDLVRRQVAQPAVVVLGVVSDEERAQVPSCVV